MRKPLYFLLLFVSVQALADEQPESKSESKPASEQVVVTGTRTSHLSWESPIATETIVIDDEALSHYKNVAEILAQTPGLDVVTGLRGQNLRLDGFDPKYTLVLIDGQRMEGRIGDAYDLEALELEGIQRIEIIRGAGSALYGSDAIAGVVNIITREGVRQRVRLHTDSNGQNDALLSTGFKAGDFSLAAELFGDRSRPINVPGSDATEFSGSKKYGGQIVPRYHGDTWDVRGRLHVSQEKLEGVDKSTAGAILKRSNDLATATESIEPTKTFADDSQLKLTVNHERNTDNYKQAVRRTGTVITNENTEESVLETDLAYIKPIGDNVFNLGLQRFDEDLTSDRLSNHSVDRQRSAVYFQDEYSVLGSRQWTLVPAIRQDQDTQFHSHTSKKLALRYAPTDDQNILVSYGEGYRAPSFKELYLLFENPSVGYVVEGNKDLTPESSRSIHAQYSIRSGSDWTVTADVFHNRIKDLIENILTTTDDSGTQHYTYQNIAAAETDGADLSMVKELGPYASLLVNYGFLSARDLNERVALEGRSKHTLGYAFRANYQAWGLLQQFKWQSARGPTDKSDLGNDHAILLGDLSVSYRASAFLYSVAIENLAASSGDAYWRIPPRSIGAAVTWIPNI